MSSNAASTSRSAPALPATTTPSTRQGLHKKDGTPKSPAKLALAQKKVARRSSKPFINWFQRKLAGSGKAKRPEVVAISDLGLGRNPSMASRQMGRITSSPLPIQSITSRPSRFDPSSLPRRKTRSISLNGEDSLREYTQSYGSDDASIDHSLLTRDSVWSPASAMEADDDASLRPLPPSAPPSPSPSPSSSSYLSDPRTFRSMAASTKPTTVLSIDLGGGGMAHIAQVPPTPTHIHRLTPHVRQSSSLSSAGLLGPSNSFAFAPILQGQPALRQTGSSNSLATGAQPTSHPDDPVSSVQAPLHTAHHPRNNPRPSSPPPENASVLTLASSAFAFPGRTGMVPNYAPSARGDSVSHYGGGTSVLFPDAESTSHYHLGDDVEERDFDASVRALRPRSSRRGSWGSVTSEWSADEQNPRSLMSQSARMRLSTEEVDVYETADDEMHDDESVEVDKHSHTDSSLEMLNVSGGEQAKVIRVDQASIETGNDTVSSGLATSVEKLAITNGERPDARSSCDTIAHIPSPTEAGRTSQDLEKSSVGGGLQVTFALER